MPLTIFSSSADPLPALDVLRKHEFSITETDTGWESEKTFRAGLFKKWKLRVNYDSEWCSPPNWPNQILGMQNYFRQFPMPDELAEKVSRLVGSLQCTIALVDEPAYSGEDPRFEVIHEMATAMDGILFTPGALLDAQFNILIDGEGASDPLARFPEIPEGAAVVMPAVGQADAELEDEEDEPEPIPPSATRVAERALCLTAMVARGLMEMNLQQGLEPAYSHNDLLGWVDGLGLWEELEPAESTILRTQPTEADNQDSINAVWRAEGLGVLAWALGLHTLAPYDDTVDVDPLLDSLGFQPDLSRAEELRRNPVLKSPNALANLREQMFAFHWRLVDYRVSPREVDYAKMQEECWFGPLDLSWAKFEGEDLAIQGKAITKADPDLVKMVSSIASERHLAANWLMGDSVVYSETEVNT